MCHAAPISLLKRIACMKGTAKQMLWLHVSAALLLAWMGITPFGSDMLLLVSRCHQIDMPNLLEHDLYFGMPAGNYAFTVRLLHLLGMLIPLPYGTVLLHYLSTFILVWGVWRCACACTDSPVPILAIPLFMLMTGTYLFGNTCMGETYHPQYTAFGFMAALFAFLIERRFFPAALMTACCAIFHPLMGLYGLVVSLIGLLVCRYQGKNILLALSTLGAAFYFAIWPSIHSGGLDQDRLSWRVYTNLLLYFRAPGHHYPPSWGASMIVIACLVAIVGLLLAKRDKMRLAIYLLLCLACVSGSINNMFFQMPALVLANPLKLGPAMWLLSWAMIAAYCCDLVASRWPLCALLILSAQTICTLLFAVLIIETGRHIAAQRAWTKIAGQRSIGDDLIFFLVGLIFTLTLASFKANYTALALQSILLIIGAIVLRPQCTIAGIHQVAALMLSLKIMELAVLGQIPRAIELQHKPERAWQSVCRYIERNTSTQACFIIPPDKEDFQLLTKRAAFASFKHFPFQPALAREWGRRMHLLGALALSEGEVCSVHQPIVCDLASYRNMQSSTIASAIAAYDMIDYCIAYKGTKLPYPSIYANEAYSIYRLRK